MTLIVERILSACMNAFHTCSTNPHLQHQYSKEMSAKSEVCTIGIIQENPGTPSGMLKVCDELHELLVPYPEEGRPYPLPLWGDALSVLVFNKAARNRNSGRTTSERLEGMWAVPGDFHRRMLHLEDTYRILFHQDSAGDRGTLSQIKDCLNFHGVKSKVSSSFNQCEDMLHITTMGYVCLTAMKLLGLKSLDEQLAEDKDPDQVLVEVAEKVTTFFWKQTSFTNIMEVADARVEGWEENYGCVCGEIVKAQILVSFETDMFRRGGLKVLCGKNSWLTSMFYLFVLQDWHYRSNVKK